MGRQTGRKPLCSVVIALALLLSDPGGIARAAEDPARALPSPANAATGPDDERDDELDEIVVTGTRRNRKPQALIEWLRRLVGRFAYEGYVELQTDDARPVRQPVTGYADCVGFGPAPGVQCDMRITWPELRGPNGEELVGGVSSLAPAMTLFGLEVNYLAIRYLQLDSRGLANGGWGYLQGDTVTTREPCVDIPGNCRRITHISARADGKLIQTQVDIEVDGKRLVRFMFVQRRVMSLDDALRVPK